MILIWGSRWRKSRGGHFPIPCLLCEEMSLQECAMQRWFTFFFIPIFPTSRKDPFVTCLSCDNEYKFKPEFYSELKKTMEAEKVSG